MKNKIMCYLFGHKYKLFYRYNVTALFKCEKCGKKKHDFIWGSSTR